MQKHTHLSLMLALSLLFVASNTIAQDHAGHGAHTAGPAKPAAAKETVEQLFARFDANKDGFVEKSELPAKHPLLAHFGMADKNRDGKLDLREFKLGMSML